MYVCMWVCLCVCAWVCMCMCVIFFFCSHIYSLVIIVNMFLSSVILNTVILFLFMYLLRGPLSQALLLRGPKPIMFFISFVSIDCKMLCLIGLNKLELELELESSRKFSRSTQLGLVVFSTQVCTPESQRLTIKEATIGDAR